MSSGLGAGRREGGMEAQTGPVNEELRPPSGLGAGHACFKVGEF